MPIGKSYPGASKGKPGRAMRGAKKTGTMGPFKGKVGRSANAPLKSRA